jgi:serine/threonine protein kinase
VDGVDHCIWAACPGADQTLQQYLEPTPRLPELARALGVVGADVDFLSADEERALFRKLLKELLEAVALINMHGVVHRDIKPENVLVDTRTHSLRLIDFGAACGIDTPDTVMLLASGQKRDASFKATRAVGSRVYMPPEISHTATMTYDVYSVAIVWLRALAPALASKRMLDEFRTVVASNHHHLIEDWLDHGFELQADDHRLLDLEHTEDSCVFAGDVGMSEVKLAWRLLRAMLRPDPTERVTAAEALAGPYLGGCAGIDATTDTVLDPFTASFRDAPGTDVEAPDCTRPWRSASWTTRCLKQNDARSRTQSRS